MTRRRLSPVAALALLSAATWVGTLASPALATASPLLLVVLAPRAPFVALAAGSTPLPALIILAMVRMSVHAPFSFMVGSRYGAPAATWLARRSRLAGVVASATLHLFRRFSYLAVLVRPSQTMLMLAGAARLRRPLTGLCVIAGTAAYVTGVALTAQWAVAQIDG